jgi:hypothetical protein
MDIDLYDLNSFMDIDEVDHDEPMELVERVTATVIKADSNSVDSLTYSLPQETNNNRFELPGYGNNDRMINQLYPVFDRDPNAVANEGIAERSKKKKRPVRPLSVFSDDTQTALPHQIADNTITHRQSAFGFLSLDAIKKLSLVYDSYATMIKIAEKYPINNSDTTYDITNEPEWPAKEEPRKMPTYLSAVASTNIKLRGCDRYRNSDRIIYRRPQKKVQKKKARGLRVLASSFKRPLNVEPTVASVLEKNRANRQTPLYLMRWRHRIT